MRWTVWLFALACSCRSESPPEPASPDPGRTARTESPDAALPGVDLSYALPPGWVAAGLPQDERVVDARLYPREGEKFIVAPRLVVTVEPLEAGTSYESAFEQVLDSVRAQGEAPPYQLLRSSKSTGRHPLGQVADVEVAFRVHRSENEPGPELIHRSWVLIRRLADGSHARVTLTMTYLNRDADRIDVEAAIAGFEAVEPTPDDGSSDAG